MQIFLGGTCGKNNWREAFTKALLADGILPQEIYNPVVADWNDEVQRRQESAKKSATHRIFYIGDPGTGCLSAYSMVEATMGLYDKPDTTVVVFDNSGFSEFNLAAMNRTLKTLRERFPNGKIMATPKEAIGFLVVEKKLESEVK